MPQLKKSSKQHDARENSILVENARIWRAGSLQRASILVHRGKIVKIARRVDLRAERRVKGGDFLAIPGLIDVHVHLRDMALAYKEDFTTGTSAAAAGGFTTILDMPNTRPPTDSVERLEEKISVAANKILVNVGFHTAAVDDANETGAMAKAGSFSEKLYLPNPIAPIEVGSDRCLARIIGTAARHGLPVTVHAEDENTLAHARKPAVGTISDLVSTRPPLAETKSISRILRLRATSNARVHFCHLTLPDSVQRANRAMTSHVTTEVTPHHILLSRKSLARKEWRAWMVPPLRSENERKLLFRLAAEGRVSLVASDHAPHTIEEKSAVPRDSPPGVPGLETTLPLFLTMVNRGRMALARVLQLLCEGPARVFGLASKGELDEGKDGDIVLIDLKRKSKVRADSFRSKAKFSPFEGTRTMGTVETTIVGGIIVYEKGQIVADPGTGRVLRRG